jgi:hypothetical protein
MMQWLRLYDDLLDDPKVQRLSPELFKHWINILCLANKGAPRGTLPSTSEDFAFRLRVSREELTHILVQLSEAGLLERDNQNRLRPHGWEARQFKSDDVNARVKAHRERNVPSLKEETLHATLHVTAPDTDTDTETEDRIEESHDSSLAGSRQPYPDEFELFWKTYGPTNGAKKPAYTAWKSLSKAHRAAAIAALPAWLGSVKWQSGFKDYPQKYLNQRFWEADPAAGSNGASPNGRVDARVDKRPAIKPYEPGTPKQLSPEKREAILRMREELSR